MEIRRAESQDAEAILAIAVLKRACLAIPLLCATPALADAPRDFCADRPGLGTPACTLAPGAAMLELGVAGWERTTDPATVSDDITLGDALFRFGLTETTEVQIGVTSHVIQRQRDRASGAVDRVSGVGDGTFAIRQSLSGANGPVAIMATVTVPVAKQPIGSGEWSGGVLLPFGFDLGQDTSLDFTPEIDWSANAARSGHHLAWGGVVGVTRALGKQVSLTGEVAAFRDDDPDGRSTDARVAASLAW